MLLYIILWFILLFCSFIKNKYNKIIFWILIILLSIVSGVRDIDVGTDTETYFKIMRWIKNGEAKYIEPGWRFLNNAVIILGCNYNLLLLLVSSLTLLPVAYVITKNSPNWTLSLFFYYSMYLYLNSFNIMRQVLATSFIILAFHFLLEIKKRLILFGGTVLVATTFHYTAVVSIITFIYQKIKLSKYKIYGGLLFSFIAGTFFMRDHMLKIVAGPYYSYFIEKPSFGFRESLVIPIILTVILNVLFFICYNTSNNEFKTNIWTKLFLLFIITNNLTYTLVLGSRIILYFSVAQVIFFPLYLKNSVLKEKKLLLLFVIIYFSLLFYKILLQNGSGVYPYKIFFLS